MLTKLTRMRQVKFEGTTLIRTIRIELIRDRLDQFD